MVWDSRSKYSISNNIEELLEKNCEVEKLINFIRDIGLFEDMKMCIGKEMVKKCG